MNGILLKAAFVFFLCMTNLTAWSSLLQRSNCDSVAASRMKELFPWMLVWKCIAVVDANIRRYQKDPKKNVLQSAVTRSNSPKYCQNVSKTVVWYLRICKRTDRTWRIVSSANASEQSRILCVLCYEAHSIGFADPKDSCPSLALFGNGKNENKNPHRVWMPKSTISLQQEPADLSKAPSTLDATREAMQINGARFPFVRVTLHHLLLSVQCVKYYCYNRICASLLASRPVWIGSKTFWLSWNLPWKTQSMAR